jgi:hypothetical protein
MEEMKSATGDGEIVAVEKWVGTERMPDNGVSWSLV